jgi:hypothetical protein
MMVGKATGWKAGRCWHVLIIVLFSIEQLDQAVMDFLVATQVGEFLSKCSSGMQRAQGLGLRSRIGGNRVIPFFLAFFPSSFPNFSYLSFVSGDEG